MGGGGFKLKVEDSDCSGLRPPKWCYQGGAPPGTVLLLASTAGGESDYCRPPPPLPPPLLRQSIDLESGPFRLR